MDKTEMNQYRYTVYNDGATFEGVYLSHLDWRKDYVESIAESAAAYYCSENNLDLNGNESISIQIFEEDGTSLGFFSAGYRYPPYRFTAFQENGMGD